MDFFINQCLPKWNYPNQEKDFLKMKRLTTKYFINFKYINLSIENSAQIAKWTHFIHKFFTNAKHTVASLI